MGWVASHSRCMRSMDSSVRAPRSRFGTPTAANSSSIQPEPTPSTIRPSDSRSSDASSWASTTGWRYGTTSTLVPIVIRSVAPATTPITAMGSSQSMPGENASSVVDS